MKLFDGMGWAPSIREDGSVSLAMTYADREAISDSLQQYQSTHNLSDKELLQQTSHLVKELNSTTSFQDGFLQNTTWLANHLRLPESSDAIKDVVRGALAFCIEISSQSQNPNKNIAALTVARVAHWAVQRVEEIGGKKVSFSPPALSDEEKKQAENMLLEFALGNDLKEAELIEPALKVVEEIRTSVRPSFYKRFHENVDFLVRVVKEPSAEEEKRSYALAALKYIVHEDDVIHDSLGVLGYIDDFFVIETAVELIEPGRQPWKNLIDKIFSHWPFLKHLGVRGSGKTNILIPEYYPINAALNCHALIGKDVKPIKVVVEPVSESASLFAALIGALDIYDKEKSDKALALDFKPGQKVKSSDGSISEFTGIEIVYGKEMFGLRQYPKKGGKVNPAINYRTIEELNLLTPVDDSRVPRGRIHDSMDSVEKSIPALERILDMPMGNINQNTNSCVLVVDQVRRVKDFAETVTIYEQPVKNIVSIASIGVDESKLTHFSHTLKSNKPTIVVAPNLMIAKNFVRNTDREIKQIIVQSQSATTLKKAHLWQPIKQAGLPTLVFLGAEATDDLDDFNENDYSLWEWEPRDIQKLYWENTEDNDDLIVSWTNQIQRADFSAPDIEVISQENLEKSWKLSEELARCVRAREDLPESLDRFAGLIFSTLHLLMTDPLSITTQSRGVVRFEEVKGLWQSGDVARYCTDKEHEIIWMLIEEIGHLTAALMIENPKHKKILEMSDKDPSLQVLLGQRKINSGVSGSLSTPNVNYINRVTPSRETTSPLLLPAWTSRARMKKYFLPKISNQLSMILYEKEFHRYEQFVNDCRRRKQARVAQANRTAFFPEIKGWINSGPPVDVATNPVEVESPPPSEAELFGQEQERRIQRQLVRDASGEKGDQVSQARLVVFNLVQHAFFTPHYQAQTVTHLLDGAATENEQNIQYKKVDNLVPGDAILFSVGRETDVIKEAADKKLNKTDRATADMWRQALKTYKRKHNLKTSELHAKMKSCGFDKTAQTLRLWLDNEDLIGPSSPSQDLQIILDATKDETLSVNLERAVAAIEKVRSAHKQASRAWAKKIVKKAAEICSDFDGGTAELGENACLVRVNHVLDDVVEVRTAKTNRLLEGETWFW